MFLAFQAVIQSSYALSPESDAASGPDAELPPKRKRKQTAKWWEGDPNAKFALSGSQRPAVAGGAAGAAGAASAAGAVSAAGAAGAVDPAWDDDDEFDFS